MYHIVSSMLDATCSSCPATVSIEPSLVLVVPCRFTCPPPPSPALASMCSAVGVREVKRAAASSTIICWGADIWDSRLRASISTRPWWCRCGLWLISFCTRRGDCDPTSADLAFLVAAAAPAAVVDNVEVEGRPLFLGCVRSFSNLSFFLLFLNHSCTWKF